MKCKNCKKELDDTKYILITEYNYPKNPIFLHFCNDKCLEHYQAEQNLSKGLISKEV